MYGCTCVCCVRACVRVLACYYICLFFFPKYILGMLLGKPQQASEYYNFAVKIFKDTNDFLWLGCALEGCGACILLDAEVGNVEAVFEGNDADRELEVIGRFREVRERLGVIR